MIWKALQEESYKGSGGNAFLRQSVREQQLPFVVSKNMPNEVTLNTMDAAERGEDMYGPFESVDDLIEALNA